MVRRLSLLALFVLPCSVLGQSVPTAPSSASVLLGARLEPVPAFLRSHLPQLAPDSGLIVADLPADSQGAKAGLRAHDVLAKYDRKPLRDLASLIKLVDGPPVPRETELEVFRAGKALALMLPPLFDWRGVPQAHLKGVAPPSVSVEALPLPGGKLQVALTYYRGGDSKLEKYTCTGALSDIETEVRQLKVENRLPPQVHDLVDVALRQLRSFKAP